MSSLVISAKQDNSAQLVAAVAQQISWRKLWDMALDKGTHGTSQIQCIVRHLSHRIYKGYICPLCDSLLPPYTKTLCLRDNINVCRSQRDRVLRWTAVRYFDDLCFNFKWLLEVNLEAAIVLRSAAAPTKLPQIDKPACSNFRFFNMGSMAIRNKRGERAQLCFTPIEMGN